MLNPYNLVLFIIAMLFILGIVTFIAGILILTLRAYGSDVKALAVQTARLAHKGITEDVAGLVGNAADLLESLNQLVLTTRGVGIFLTVLGMLLMGLACWFAVQVYRMKP